MEVAAISMRSVCIYLIIKYTWARPSSRRHPARNCLYDLPDRQKALPAPRPSSSAICCCFCAAVGRCDAASISAALAACSALPPSTWPLAICRGFVACLPETVFSRCRALRSRASSEELKARNAKRKLKNLEFCHHADNAKFEKAIPVPTHASTLHPPTQRPSPPRRPVSYHRWRACARSV